MQEKVRKKFLFANRDSKIARIRQIRQTKTNPMLNWSNPPEIRQKLGVRQKYFLPAGRLSDTPEFSKYGGENRHLATLKELQESRGKNTALSSPVVGRVVITNKIEMT
jgi:hypothetical protein